MQLCVYLIEGPGQSLRVLAHLQSGCRNTAGIGCLTRREENSALLEQLYRFRSRRHVRALRYSEASVGLQILSILQIQLVLCRARQRYIAGDIPYTLARTVLNALLLDQIQRNAFRIVYGTRGIGHGYDLGAELLRLLYRIDRNITGTGYADSLALQALSLLL